MCAALAETALAEQWQSPSERVEENIHWYRMTEVEIGLRSFLVFAGIVAAMLAIDTLCIWMLISLQPEAVDINSDWASCWCSVFPML